MRVEMEVESDAEVLEHKEDGGGPIDEADDEDEDDPVDDHERGEYEEE